MRLIDADELLEHVYRDRLDSRKRIADLVKSMPTVQPEVTAEMVDLYVKPRYLRVISEEFYLHLTTGKYLPPPIFQPTQPERKTGKWEITDAYPHNVYCSECHKRFAQTHWAVWEDGSLPRSFCPNCGTDMRGEQDE